MTGNPAILLLGVYPPKLKIGIQTNTCTWMFIAALFTIPKGRKNPTPISVWMNKQNVDMHTMGMLNNILRLNNHKVLIPLQWEWA